MTLRRSRALAIATSALVSVGLVAATVPTAAVASTGGYDISRISGTDRYSTSAAISSTQFADAKKGGIVYVASGANFPDALSAAPAAYRDGAPLLLVGASGPAASVWNELVRLAPKEVIVVGGTGSVSNAALTQIKRYWKVTRVAGADRYSTSAAASKRAFPAGAETVYLATGMNYPDALSAAPIAAQKGAPILLTSPTSLSAQTRTELTRLKAKKVVIVGGTGAVSAAVASQVAQTGASVTRVGGASRYDVSAALAASIPSTASTIMVASGTGFADALSAAPAAARMKTGVLLTEPKNLPGAIESRIDRIAPDRIVVIGGPGAVSQKVVDSFKNESASASVLRLTNETRAKVGASQLASHAALDAVATAWAKEMTRSEFKHNPKVGSQIPKGWKMWGENIVLSYDAEFVPDHHELWVDSPGHYENMVHKDFTHMGYGYAMGDGGEILGVQVFARY